MLFETEKLVIANGALLRLGASKINAFDEQTDSARACVQWIDPVRREALRAHPWNFALKRKKLNGFPQATLTPASISGSNITFTASAPVFVADDVDYLLVGTTGTARITAFDNDTHVRADIESNFASTSPIAIESWRIAPAWQWDFRFVKPTDYLRVIEISSIGGLASNSIGWSWWQHRDNSPEPVKVEGQYLVTNVGQKMFIAYTRDIENPELWDGCARNAVEALLAFRICYAVTGSLQASKTQYDAYRAAIAEARTTDGQEGTGDDSGSDMLLAVRM